MTTVTLLTDFGWSDYYVAAVKGTVLRLAPGATPIDVGHDVAAGDVEGGAWLLGAAWHWFPAGTVHLAVVDPGVGSRRRIVAARGGGHLFVAPDNGLLTAVLAVAGVEARVVERDDLYLPGPGATFHGRDRFAPVAAWLARGEPFEALGPPIEDAVRLDIPPPRRDGRVLHGRVAHVDRFGNLITDLPAEWLGEGRWRLEVGGRAVERRATHFAEVPAGEAAWLVGSLGTVEVAMNGESVAARWGVGRGAGVRVRFVTKDS